MRIAFDDESIYLGVTAFDSEPEKWLGYQRRRDEGLNSDDRFMWTIDTFLDGRTGYFFEMNPSGLMADSLLGINGENREWDGIWNARALRSEIGWTLEIVIPFRTLNFNPNSDSWGINFQRTVRRKNEESLWTGWGRNQGLRRMSNAGVVTGIRDVTQGRGLDLKPYGVFASEASPGRGSSAITGDASAGIDLFYSPTPLLRTVFTVNTDFAQTEVDQRQVNLTRFSLFFPERRDFFLDGATFFDFRSDGQRGDFCCGGNDDDQVIPFFSRRIGLSASGTPQKIDFGTKITGQAGAQDIGVLHVRTGEDDGFASEDFTVARVKRRLLAQSYLGAIYSRRDPRLDGREALQTAGLDMSLSTSSFRGSQNLEAAAWFLHAAAPDVSRGNSAFGAVIDYPNDRLVRTPHSHGDSGALRPVDRLRPAQEFPEVLTDARVSAAAAEQPVRSTVLVRDQSGLHDRSRERPGDPPDRCHADSRELPVAGQLQRQHRQLPRAARHAVRHQP